ncbi:MAG: DUF3108 domain-containing protein [Thalassotalea sp.]
MFKLTTWLTLCITTIAFTAIANDSIKPQTFPIKSFSAHYNIIHKDDPVGKAVRKLSVLANDKIQYSYHTDLEWLIFSDSRSESSLLKLSADKADVIPLHYVFERSGTGRDKQSEWKFQPEENKALCINEDKEEHQITLDFTNPIQDKLSYHLQQRLNLIKNPQQKHFVYSVVQGSGKTKNYVYEYDGEDELMLPYGNVKAIRLKREVVENKKITYVWFAPELNYLLVRINQIKAGVNQFEAQLTKYIPAP